MPTATCPPFSPRSRRKLPHDPLRVVGYIRASKERQQLTPQAQLAALRRWCEAHHAVMVAHFIDQNISGATEPEDRPGMMNAVAALAVLLKQTFQWFQDEGTIVGNPALGLAIPDDGEPDLLDPPLSEGEVLALFSALPRCTAIDLRNACLLELLYGCALRLSEVLALSMQDIDLSNRTLHVRNGKGGQQRLLPVTATVLAAVQDYYIVPLVRMNVDARRD